MDIVDRLGRRFFWRIDTGNIILERTEMVGPVYETTKEQDFETYTELQKFDPDAIEMTTFEPGQYVEDFAQATGYRFDPATGEIQFSYPDPNEPDPPEPVYQPPLTEQVKKLQDENTLLKAQINAQSDRSDFIEDVIAEMASQVYQ